ncbi:MAG: hypothetical protein WC191_08105 [Proteiniphilum sp.]|jgi:hypothetical protein|nr:hypothetical protein [Bacteroidales bacterium]MDD3978978.1 hypothetical protein [Proteiniphilum sp.]MDY0316854.1 hypothetical protein [Acholeplasmatales bacterium]
MKEKLIDKQTTEHYFGGDNCDYWELTETSRLSVKQECMPGGTKEKLHFHTNVQQFFCT